jgi:hypothetical protein
MIESRSTSYGFLALPAAACEAEADAEADSEVLSVFSVLGAPFSLVALVSVVGLGSAPAASVSGGEYSPYCLSGVG